MTSVDKVPTRLALDSLHRRRHKLRTPLTAISINAQVLVQDLLSSPTLAEEERTQLLASLTAIEAAIQALSTEIDAISADDCEPDYPTEPQHSP